MFQRILRLGAAVLAVLFIEAFPFPAHAVEPLVEPPRVGAWQYRVERCSNWHQALQWARDCQHLDGGVWQGTSNPVQCADMRHPMPWSTEAMFEPRVSARESGRSANFEGWLSAGETLTCIDWPPIRMRFTYGIESSNVGWIRVDGDGPDFLGLRNRSVSCRHGYEWDGTHCVLAPGRLTRFKNNDECPAQETGPNPSRNGSQPVHAATGQKLQREQDYRGHGPFPLEFTRFYASGTHLRFANLGTNWRHTYARAVQYLEYRGVQYATVVRPGGNEYVFRRDANGNWVGDADVPETLETEEGSEGAITGWRYRNRADELEEYDAQGRLTRITSREGFVHTLVHDLESGEGGDGNPETLDRVEGPFPGQALQFGYTHDGKIARITLQPSGDTIRFEYQGRLLTKVVYPDASSREYRYDESAHRTSSTSVASLTGLIDESGRRAASWWYSGNRVVRSQRAPNDLAGVDRVDFAYPGGGQTAVTDALGQTRNFRFQHHHGAARVAAIEGAACAHCGGQVQAATYDARGYRQTETDFNGNVTRYEHDALGRETLRVDGYGTAQARSTVTQWHPQLRLPTQIDVYAGEALGVPLRRTRLTYVEGRVVSRAESDPATGLERRWSYTYNAAGLLTGVSSPGIGEHTNYAYDVLGRRIRTTNALGHETRILAHDDHGQPLSVLDPNGVLTTLTYDARQRLTGRTTAGESTIFAYTPTGQLARITFADGSFVAYSYDAADRLVEVADSQGHRIAYTLDPLGNRVAEERFDDQGQLRAVQTRVFDELNRLWKEIGAAGTEEVTTTYSYDGNGRLTGLLAPLGRATEQLHDTLNRPTRIIDALGGVTEFTYDALDRIIAVRDPRGVVTTYAYDGLGNRVREDSPDAGSTVQTHDAAGRVRTRTDARGHTLTYDYDALGRVTRADTGDTTWVHTYDAGANGIGHLTAISDGRQTLSWEYDAQGRVLAREQRIDGIVLTLRYSYGDGQKTGVKTPSGQRIGYAHAFGRPDRVTLNGTTVLVDEVAYEPFGPVNGWRWGDGTRTTRSHDLDLRPVLIDSAGRRSYSYDPASRIDGIVDLQDLARSRGYVYDALDRLTEASGTGTLQRWTYDANGNRLRETGDTPADYTPAADSNRLLTIRGALQRDHIHDAAGNLLEDGRRSFRYNAAGRMVSATVEGNTTTYLYNALGERVRKQGEQAPPQVDCAEQCRALAEAQCRTRFCRFLVELLCRLRHCQPGTSAGGEPAADGQRYFVYDEDGRLIGEYGPNGELIHETVWLDDIPIAALYPDGNGGVQVYYVHTDHLNTPRRLTRPGDGTIVWRWDSDPFGTTAADEDPDGDGERITYPLRFPGQYHDPETGLHYNYFRDYDPSIGRYVQSDPIGLEGGLNRYLYVYSDPINAVDTEGLRSLSPQHRPHGFRRDLHDAFSNLNDPAPHYYKRSRRTNPASWGCGCLPFRPMEIIGTMKPHDELKCSPKRDLPVLCPCE